MCGTIRYAVHQKPKHQALCHCRDCRKAVGAQAVAWITVDKDQFQYTSGKPAVFKSSPHVIRTFCSICGTTLTYQEQDRPNDIDITTGSTDDPEPYGPEKDVFIDEKLSWVNSVRVKH